MQTRAAARRLAEAAARINASPADAASQESSCDLDPSDAPGFSNNTRSGSKSTAGSKRKRVTTKQTQPLKGGWILPHGMGVRLTESDASHSQGVEPATSSSPLLKGLPAVPESAQSNPPTVAARPGRKNNSAKQTKQTRLSSRVTKVGVNTANKVSETKQDPAIKREDDDSIVGPLIKQEDDHLNKRLRTSSASLVTAKVAENAVPGDSTVASSSKAAVKVKLEEKQTTSGAPIPTPKVLIIKGIAIKDNIAARVSDKVIVDATQILDPNLKLKVKRGKENPYGLTPGFSPYPYRRVPTPEACEEVYRILAALHGEVKQPEKIPAASLEIAGCGEVPCVLDALLRTLISGNTLMALADAAIKNLAQHYGTRQEGSGFGSINWDKVRLSSHQELAEVIKVAGNGPKRSHHIKQILDMVYEENLERAKKQSAARAGEPGREEVETGPATHDLLSLDYMHSMSKDEAMAKFVSYPGIGIKTAACVTLFCLRMPCFAVDTHVHKFCRWLGWVPEKADADNCFRHGDFMVPDHLKYGLHQLFIRHGQQCFKCRKATKPGTKVWKEAPECPLEHLLDRSKDEAGSRRKQEDQEGEEEQEQEQDSGSDGSDEDDGEMD